jgi:hypothetical protein
MIMNSWRDADDDVDDDELQLFLYHSFRLCFISFFCVEHSMYLCLFAHCVAMYSRKSARGVRGPDYLGLQSHFLERNQTKIDIP